MAEKQSMANDASNVGFNPENVQAAVIRHAQRDLSADPMQVQPQGIVEPEKAPSLWQAFKESKLLGEFSRWFAAGAKDLYNAVAPAFPDSARAVDEPGTPLNPTQFMVTQEVGGYDAYDREIAAAAARPQQEHEHGLER